jgi:hypothetical protein
MLQGPHNIAWHDTHGSYGPVPDMPLYLERLASPDPLVCGRALRWIGDQLEHQGTRWHATAITIPFLIEILSGSATACRAALVWLLLGLAADESRPLLPDGFDPNATFARARTIPADPERVGQILSSAYAGGEYDPDAMSALDERIHERWHYDAYRAVERGCDVLVRLTDDSDPAVRVPAVRALGWFPAAAARSRPFVRTAAEREEDAHRAGNALMTLGLVGRYVGDHGDAAWLTGRLSPDKPLIVRRCAALALGTLLRTELPDDALRILIDATEDQATLAEDARRMSWRGCSFAGYFWRVLHSLGF